MQMPPAGPRPPPGAGTPPRGTLARRHGRPPRAAAQRPTLSLNATRPDRTRVPGQHSRLSSAPRRSPDEFYILVLLWGISESFILWNFYGTADLDLSALAKGRTTAQKTRRRRSPSRTQPQPQPCKLPCLPSSIRSSHRDSLPYGSAPLTPHVSPPHASAVDEFRCLACMPGPHDILPMHTLRQIKLARGRRKS